jgi:hypothetical protein
MANLPLNQVSNRIIQKFSKEKKSIMSFFHFKIAGKHLEVYEAYYKQLDPKQTDMIQSMSAAKFLKKSGLSDVVLSRVNIGKHIS